jgi:hypothetical protein
VWEGEYFETIEALELENGEFLYRLKPWSEAHTIRRIESYDDESEQRRIAAWEKKKRTEKWRRVVVLTSPFTGLLPADAQFYFERELGVLAGTQTMISSASFLLVGAVSTAALILQFFHFIQNGPPPSLLFLGATLFFDSLIRLRQNLADGLPMGCYLFGIPYAFVRATRHRETLGTNVPQRPVPSETSRRDLYHVIEPVAALLRPEEQERLVRDFQFDALDWGRKTAAVILVIAIVGAFTSFDRLSHSTHGNFGAFVSAFAAIGLIAEQLFRLDAIRRKQKAGSILGALLRPFVRDLFLPKEAARDESHEHENQSPLR